MRIQINGDSDELTLSFQAAPKPNQWLHLLWVALLLVVICLIGVHQWVVVIGAGAFVLAGFYAALRSVYGVSVLTITPELLRLQRKTLGIGTTRTIQRHDLERFGYSPEINGYRSHEDSGLAMMCRTDMLPILFARTISPAEAEDTLAKIKQSGTWLADFIRPVGTPMF